MTDRHRRGVTRGYVLGLVFAVAIAGFALMLTAWSLISLAAGGGPVSTPGIGFSAAAMPVLLCLGLLAWLLWSQSLLLLRGRRQLSWRHLLVASFGGYLLWGLVGTLLGLSLADTWLSPYVLALAVSWALATVLCWAVLLRRVYTDRPAPRWPWEKRGELGPDLVGTDEDPWAGPRDGDDGEAR